MDHKRRQTLHYEPGQWRVDEPFLSREERVFTHHHRDRTNPDVWDRSRLLELLGLINYKVLTGNRVYVQVGGVVYRTIYGGYWRSVFTGIETYLLRCEEIRTSTWTDGSGTTAVVDLPILYSGDGWTAMGHPISFLIYSD